MSVPFTRGLHQPAPDTFAYLEPDGSWGRGNSGLVVDGGDALLIDTLFTLAQTTRLLDAIGEAVPDATIRTLVNTHDDPDHWWGNQLVENAEIIASDTAARHMRENRFRTMLDAPELAPGLRDWMTEITTRFDFAGIVPTPPTRTFSGRTQITVGRRTVDLLEAGPAHTHGDVLVHVPDTRTVFAGDLLFVGIHPVIHSGPIDGWITACRTILDLEPEIIVPGHGPVTDVAYVHAFREYLCRVRDHAHISREAGRTVVEAARSFDLGPWPNLLAPERVLLNIGAVYREFDGAPTELELLAMLPSYTAI